MIKNFTYLILAFLFSCSDTKIEEISYDLVAEKIIFEELILPSKIRIKNDKIIILEKSTINSDFSPGHIIDLNTFSYLYSFGKIGYGPGEISDATNMDLGMSDSTFWIYSAIDKKMSEFSLKNPSSISISQFRQPSEFYKAYSVLFSSDSTILGMTVDSPSRLIDFSLQSQEQSYYGSLENYTNRTDLDSFHLAQINMGWFSSNQEKSIFVIGCIFYDKIEIFNYKNKVFKTIYGKNNKIPYFELLGASGKSFVHWDLDNPYHYRDIVVNKDLIFSLYGGYSQNQINKDSQYAKTIFIHKVNGEFICKFNLDQSILSLAVSPDNRTIVGITTDKDPGMAIYKIPEDIIF